MISIIIPIFNTPYDILKRCVLSILANDCADYEVILIDDGSYESNSMLYKGLCHIDNRVQYYKFLNSGPSEARNKGVVKSKGDYVTFVDADDYVSPFFLGDAQYLITKFTNPDLIIGLVKNTGFENIEFHKNKIEVLELLHENDKEILINHMLGQRNHRFDFHDLGHISDGPIARVLKRSLFKKINFNKDVIWNEDTIWNIKLVAKCNRVLVTNRTWYMYFNYSASATNRFRKNCLNEFYNILPLEFDIMKNSWPNNYIGIYYMMYKDLQILNRTYIFHKENSSCIIDKFRDFRHAIEYPLMKEALKSILENFSFISIKSLAKFLLCLDMTYGSRLFSFCVYYIKYYKR